ncbi:MAG: four helix bundle protein [Kiritimatiellae bacterium]|nr:four helix bundle protein [Kiritimatiellia bacterium]
MAKVERFEDLEVWQRARQLTGKIYACARHGEFARDYGFRDQICRAAVSVVSNVAEGFDRRSNSQFLQFLDIANGSAGELRAQLYIALDLAYISANQFQDLYSDVTTIGKMLTSLIRHLRSSPNHPPLKPSNP